MHKQLSNQSGWIDQLVNEMQDYVTTNPQSQTCQSLLEQVQQVFIQNLEFCEFFLLYIWVFLDWKRLE